MDKRIRKFRKNVIDDINNLYSDAHEKHVHFWRRYIFNELRTKFFNQPVSSDCFIDIREVESFLNKKTDELMIQNNPDVPFSRIVFVDMKQMKLQQRDNLQKNQRSSE